MVLSAGHTSRCSDLSTSTVAPRPGFLCSSNRAVQRLPARPDTFQPCQRDPFRSSLQHTTSRLRSSETHEPGRWARQHRAAHTDCWRRCHFEHGGVDARLCTSADAVQCTTLKSDYFGKYDIRGLSRRVASSGECALLCASTKACTAASWIASRRSGTNCFLKRVPSDAPSPGESTSVDLLYPLGSPVPCGALQAKGLSAARVLWVHSHSRLLCVVQSPYRYLTLQVSLEVH